MFLRLSSEYKQLCQALSHDLKNTLTAIWPYDPPVWLNVHRTQNNLTKPRCFLYQIVLTTAACFWTESTIISGPNFALRGPLSCYFCFVARLVGVQVLTWCPAAPMQPRYKRERGNQGTSWSEAKPGALFILCFVLVFLLLRPIFII